MPVAVREDLIAVAFLSMYAPRGAALTGVSARALAAVRDLYPSAEAFDEALAGALRRASTTAVLQFPERVDPVDGQRAVLAARAEFQGLLDTEAPLISALAALLDRLLGKAGARVAGAALDAFRVQAADLFPRDADAARLVLKALDGVAAPDAHAALAVEEERAGLHILAGDTASAAGLRGAADARTLLAEADARMDRGDAPGARALLERAGDLFQRAADLAGLAAVKRRMAAVVAPDARVDLLREAVRLSRHVGDLRGEAEGLEDLSRAWADAGRNGPAVAALGCVAARMRAEADAAGEARALQLAGRLLCEAPDGVAEPGPGLVMLLFAADIGGSVDPVVADLVKSYVAGFSYTLTEAQFSAIEPLFDADRDALVSETFTRYRNAHASELP